MGTLQASRTLLGCSVPQYGRWEQVLPRRNNAAVQRARPGRRRQSGGSRRGGSQSEQGTAANEAAGVALATLLESSGEWTYEQLIALDDGVQRDGLSLMFASEDMKDNEKVVLAAVPHVVYVPTAKK